MYVGEVGTAVYVVNVPACWPLVRKLLPRVFGSSGTNGTGRSSIRLRSDTQKPSHRPRVGLSESEENLASERSSAPQASVAQASGQNVNGYHYWAEATGANTDKTSAAGIVKTVQVDVS